MLTRRMDHLLEHFIENGPPGAALKVVQNGKILYEGFHGVADIEAKEPIKQDTIYRIYSMSKIITCVAALKLLEEGKFLLSDPLEDYLHEFRNMEVIKGKDDQKIHTVKAKRSIRIKDLFTMTSGLVYGGDNTEVERMTRQIMIKVRDDESIDNHSKLRLLSKQLATLPLEFEPASEWKYGLSHDVLGALIEVISGKSFGTYLKDEIFDPLQMNDTFFKVPEDKKSRLASLYDRDEAGNLKRNTILDSAAEPIAVFESGGAGLHSTLDDYSKFAQALANGGKYKKYQLLSPHTISLLSTNHLTPALLNSEGWDAETGYGYGLGVRVMIDKAKGGSNSSIGEFGWSGLAGTYVSIDPLHQLSVVYMQQMLPNFEAYHQPRIRNVVYGSLY
ncbi:serine hydrolase domain-containing protein [Saliterribacillus persicus]|uniref:CubicO group peptidase (Beta-lactamase class C family) n=1 Tax=Saliterribacillus persicus TaxID=930114 RepID=A0A368XXQ4_9BACI|nr:serine hydrolase domain-containing protein [Saliterribacillus persicus]RCW71916.1 CubicO group peptidase (beta-lactamase class C family) [Saliterribacillus persicus]